MFRNPRHSTSNGEPPLLPSIGRPPTPPSAPSIPALSSKREPIMATTVTPLLGRSRTVVKRSTSAGKSSSKGNGSILSFFKPAGPGDGHPAAADEEEETLFLESSPAMENGSMIQIPTPPQDTLLAHLDTDGGELQDPTSPLSRFNETGLPQKRRKLEETFDMQRSHEAARSIVKTGPFLDDSDEEIDHPMPSTLRAKETIPHTAPAHEDATHDPNVATAVDTIPDPSPADDGAPHNANTATDTELDTHEVPELKKESTSFINVDDFEGIEDFIDDEFPAEGEEYLERRWMEEQAELEMGLENDDDSGEIAATASSIATTDDQAESKPPAPTASACPMCGGNTSSLSEQQISMHVNDCMDGKAKPLPKVETINEIVHKSEIPKTDTQVPVHKRFNKAAIARPGQENPINFSATAGRSSSSAFSKLMSGHAEDTAWAAAAASESASRGKPAYQRTCPFYKIMPGFYICVDAFRYGAVKGCNAYFLSHFHSDHYIGLTSQWCHGPIYCSRVTGNLVRRQLRVDPKWVVDLKFEEKVEVPNTDGVHVTMIPANHCPGSSLYLFEKAVGTGRNPRSQRILHCGDFRACPAHVQHPKLRPDILSTAGRNIGQQKIDVCYLDTTYLTPKYAFPSQEEVIKACGDMCVSLSKDFVDEDDSWEQTKKERAGSGMVKFVRKSSIKEEEGEAETEDGTKIKLEDPPPGPEKKARGRLLVIVGTYSIGKERICVGVAKALRSKIYAPPNKQKIVAALEDPELSSLMTNDPLEAQVHMQMLMEIRAETLADYLTGYKPHFSRIVGFRPSGWNYRPPNSRFTESPSVQTVLHSDNWKSRYSMAELVPQRGSTRESNCFGVPYSEHSSFRELTMFCCALRIDKIIPTVNVGSAKSRERMKAWCEKWAMEKKKNGLYKVEDGQVAW